MTRRSRLFPLNTNTLGVTLIDITLIFGRYEDYVDQKYKEHLKNQGKVDSVRTVTHSVTYWSQFHEEILSEYQSSKL